MQFGLVRLRADPTLIPPGFDYLEDDASLLLKPEFPDDQWHQPPLSTPPVRAVHSLIPESMPITGPDVNLQALRIHVQRVCERAAQIGVRTITLSSPGALGFPEGFDPKQAKSQILEFLRTAVPFFARHELMLVAGVNLPNACNVMTTLPEVLQYVWQVDHPWFQVMLDGGTVVGGEITVEQAGDAMPWVRHVHVSSIAEGVQPVFAQLKAARYQDMISVYSSLGADWSDGQKSIDLLKTAWAMA